MINVKQTKLGSAANANVASSVNKEDFKTNNPKDQI